MPPWEKGGVDKSGEADVDAEAHQDSEGQTANDTKEDQPRASEETQSANDNAEASSANGVDEGEPPFSSDTPKPQIKANRLLLQTLMMGAGFKPLITEWWHFTLLNEPYPSTYFNFPVE